MPQLSFHSQVVILSSSYSVSFSTVTSSVTTSFAMTDFFTKLLALTADGAGWKKGAESLAILNMSAYFSPGDVRIGIFTPLISDRTQRKTAVGILQQRSLVRTGSKENHFFISDSTQAEYRDFFRGTNTDVTILRNTISLMKAVKTFGDYPHFLSVYNHAKMYPELFEELDTLPANIVMGMNQCGKNEDALEFGKECLEFFVPILGKCHKTVMSLQIAMGSLLIELKKVDEAIKVSSDVLKKASVFLEINFIIGSIMLLAEAIVKNNPFGPLVAEGLLREIVFHGESVFESWSDWNLEKWVHYAKIISRFGLTDTAISILSDVMEQRLRFFSQGDDKLWEVKLTKAELFSADSRFRAALNLLRDIEEERKENFGAMHESTLRIQYEIGMVIKKQGLLQKSIGIFEDIANKSEIACDSERHLIYLKSMLEIAQIYMLLRDYEKALEHSSDIYEKLVQAFGVVHWRCYECLMVKVESLLELNKTKEVLNVLEELIEDFENFKALEEDMKRLHSMVRFIKNIDLFNAPTRSLHSFAKEGNLDEVLSLIANGEDLEATDSNGITPLQYAAVFGRVEIAKALIKKGAKYPSELPSGISPHQRRDMDTLLKTIQSFFDFVKEGNSKKVIELVSKEACVLGARDHQGCTALHWAALRDHKGILRLLLELGSDPTVVSAKGNSPLHIAASKGLIGIAETLLRAVGPDRATSMLDGRTSTGGNTPLHAAAEKGHEGMVLTLLSHGAVYCPENASFKTPVEISREDSGCWHLLRLIDSLFEVVDSNDIKLARRYMMRKEAQSNVLAVSRAKNCKNRTLMQVAMDRGYLGLVNDLYKFLESDA